LAQFDVTAPQDRLVGLARLPRQPGRGWLVGGITIAATLLLWYVLTSLTGIISSYRFPSPPEFLAALRQIAVDGYAGGTLLQQTLQSLKIVIEGFLVASLVGVPLGFLMGWSPRAEALLNPVFLLIRPIPPLAWIPLAIVWLGLGDGAKIMVIWFAAFVPSVINTLTGARQVNPILIEAARVHGATEWRVAKEVVAPAALPMIFTGLAHTVAAVAPRSTISRRWVSAGRCRPGRRGRIRPTQIGGLCGRQEGGRMQGQNACHRRNGRGGDATSGAALPIDVAWGR
jgi:taurine transport system permease protein